MLRGRRSRRTNRNGTQSSRTAGKHRGRTKVSRKSGRPSVGKVVGSGDPTTTDVERLFRPVQPLLDFREMLVPMGAVADAAEGVVDEVEGFNEVPDLVDALFETRAVLLFLGRRHLAAADRERLGVKREIVLLVVPDHGDADLPRQ